MKQELSLAPFTKEEAETERGEVTLALTAQSSLEKLKIKYILTGGCRMAFLSVKGIQNC